MTTKRVFWSLFSAALIGLLPNLAAATNLMVDCDAAGPGALTAAVNSLDIIGPHIITVTGTCTDNVAISFRERITIQAPDGQTATINAANPNRNVFDISYSREIVLRRLMIRGATGMGRNGVLVRNDSDTQIESCVVQENFRGVLAGEARVVTNNTTVSNNARVGVLAVRSFLTMDAATIENNGRRGLVLVGASHAEVSSSIIRGNGQSAPDFAAGVTVDEGSSATFFTSHISNNARYGVHITPGGTAHFFADVAPDGNPLSNSIANNGQVGLNVRGGQALLSGSTLISENGNRSDPLSAGIRVENNGSVQLDDGGFGDAGQSDVSGNRGPGIVAVNGGAVSLKAVQVSVNLIGISLDGGTLNALGMVRITSNLGLGLMATGSTIHLNDVLVAENGAPPPPLAPVGLRGGISLDGTTLTVDGKLTVENNNGPALIANGGRVNIRDTTGENFFRNNAAGISVAASASAAFFGQNTIQNNGQFGVSVGGSAQFNETVLPGGVFHATVIEGHSVAGVNALQLGAVSFSGRHIIRNNGSAAANPVLRAGVRVSRAAFTAGGGLQVTNNDASGILADFNSSVILSNATVSNNTLDGLVVTNMSIAGLFVPAGAPSAFVTISGNGNSDLTCDNSSLVIGDLSGVAVDRCKNKPPKQK